MPYNRIREKHMQEINIYVIKTEILNDLEAKNQLDKILNQLIAKYKGLTVLPLKIGYWLDNNKIFADVGEIWQILTDYANNVINDSIEIKTITKQKSQLVTVKQIDTYFL